MEETSRENPAAKRSPITSSKSASRDYRLKANRERKEILARDAWISDERIRLKLEQAGYTRSATAVHLKLKRMNFKQDGNFYSANSLANALGIDNDTVSRWIKSGHLKAQLRGTARIDAQLSCGWA